MDAIDQALKIAQLEGEVSHLRNLVSRSINVLQQVKIHLDEDDIDGARELVDAAIAE